MAATAAPAGTGVYRDGKNLVVTRGAELPPICIRCGQAATGGFLRQKLYWHEPWLYILLLPKYTNHGRILAIRNHLKLSYLPENS